MSGIAMAPVQMPEYAIYVYSYVGETDTSYRFDVVVTRNTKIHDSIVREEYSERNAVLVQNSIVEFVSESITLDIPMTGIIVGGWKLIPLCRPVVLKQHVDRYIPGMLIPKCQFYAKINSRNDDDIPPLEHRVELIGAKFPFDNVMFNITPPVADVPPAKRRKFPFTDLESRSLDSEMLPIMDKDSGGMSHYHVHKLPPLKAETKELVPCEGLKGVDVCADTHLTITNDAQSFEWKGYGLRLHIKEKSLPEDIEQITIHLMVSVSGHYDAPEGYQRVSPVFWFRCEPMCKLEKEVTLEMQHCALPEHASDLIFARADCSQKELPYTFELLKGGQFSSQSSFGILELNRFSGIVAFLKNLIWGRQYLARVYYPKVRPDPSTQEIHLVVTWNLKAYITAMEDKYPESQVKQGPSEVFQFEEDKITLNMPPGDSLGGWELIPLNAPVVKRNEMEECTEIPCRQLLARLVDPSTTSPLLYKLTLNGAEFPTDKHLTIYVPKPTAGQSGMPASLLVEQDYSKIYSKLKSHAHRWRDIGEALGFLQGELENIQSRPLLFNTAPEGWLKAMLDQWMQWAPGDCRSSPGFPTKESLQAALLKVNLGGLAQSMQEFL